MEGAGACPGDAHFKAMLTPNQWTQHLRVAKYGTISEERGEFEGPVGAWFRSSEAPFLIDYSPNPLRYNPKQACYFQDVSDAQLFPRSLMIN